MVAATQQIASAYQVHFGPYGAVTRQAHERGVCRQWIYREAQQLLETLQAAPSKSVTSSGNSNKLGRPLPNCSSN
jgi:hypothetical protein